MVCVDARHVVNLMLTDLIPLFCTEAGLFRFVIQGIQLDLYKFMFLTGRACLHCVEYVVSYKYWIFKLKFSAINYCIGNEWKIQVLCLVHFLQIQIKQQRSFLVASTDMVTLFFLAISSCSGSNYCHLYVGEGFTSI